MKKSHLPFFLLIALIIGSALAIILFLTLSVKKPLDTTVVYTEFTLSDDNLVGVNVNTTALTFGRVPRGGLSTRYVELANTHGGPVVVKIFAAGNITPHLYVPVTVFTLGQGETRNVSIAVNPNTGISGGHYEGYLAFSFYEK